MVSCSLSCFPVDLFHIVGLPSCKGNPVYFCWLGFLYAGVFFHFFLEESCFHKKKNNNHAGNSPNIYSMLFSHSKGPLYFISMLVFYAHKMGFSGFCGTWWTLE